MGSLRSKLIEDGSRASIYSILRIPLNVFAVLMLSSIKEGIHCPIDCSTAIKANHLISGEAYRDTVFTICSVLLIVAAVFAHKTLA